jgi:signal transduction histidine kinase
MPDQQQPFAAFVLETLTRRSAEVGRWWWEQTRLGAPEVGELLIRSLLDAAAARSRGDGAPWADAATRAGHTIGAEAHECSASLQGMLKELDLLIATLLETAAEAAAAYAGDAAGHEGLELAHRLTDAASLVRLAATRGYTEAVEDELRDRYRAIRHDLRNPLGTIKSAVALLTDESVPVETRLSPRVRAMVVRNASSLDQMIGAALSDAAARLPAFASPRESAPAHAPAHAPIDAPMDARPPDAEAPPLPAPSSPGHQRDDVARSRQRPNLESGAL